MRDDRAWAALRAACERPAEASAAWRAGGGRVVGLVGWSAPRELVTAAGMLPVRLAPERLAGPGPGRGRGTAPGLGAAGEPGGASGPDGRGQPGDVDGSGSPSAPGETASLVSPAGAGRVDGVGQAGGASGLTGHDAAAAFGRELTPATAALAAALLSGALGWVDFLLIGRDREDYTRLFYLLRELRRSGAAPGLPPVAFFDLLRLPSRTSARYNRQRAAELTAVIAGWAGRPVTPADLAGAAEAASAIARSFRGIQELRARPQPVITGSDALAAAVAARILPAGELRPLLDAGLAAGGPDTLARDGRVRDDTARAAAPGPGRGRPGPAGEAPASPASGAAASSPAGPAARVFLAGSATGDPAAYEALEGLGLAVVGEDHEWGDDGSEYPAATRDPLDGIVDRYHFAHGAAARAGLRERVGRTAGRVRAAAADGVLYLLGPHDEAAGWELPALREHLGGIPLVPVRLRDQRQGDPVRPEPAGTEPAQPGQVQRGPARLDPAPFDPAPFDPAPFDPVQRDQGPAGDGAWPELREAGRRLLAGLGAVGPGAGTGRVDSGREAGYRGPARGTGPASAAAEAGRG